MRLLDRYILREILGYFLLGLGVFVFVLMTPELLKVSELLARESLSPLQVAQLFFSLLPSKLVWVLPLAVLLGLLMGISRLASDLEVVALQASGVDRKGLMRPALVFAVLTGLATLIITVWWGPVAARTLIRLQEELGAEQIFYQVRPRVFEERFPGRILYIQETENAGTQWKGILLADVSQAETLRLTLAESATAVPGQDGGSVHLILRHGTTHEYVLGQPGSYDLHSFASRQLPLPVPNTRARLNRRRNAEMGLVELWQQGRAGQDDWRIHRADFHRRLALPAACLAFGLLAFPLGVLGQSSGRAVGFVMAVGFGLGYYFLFLFGDRMARDGSLPVGLGVWGANLVVAGVGLYFLHQMRRPPAGKDLSGFLAKCFQVFTTWLRRNGAKRLPGASTGSPMGLRWFKTLDVYMLEGALFHFALIETALLLLFGLFTLLEMLDEIVAQDVGWGVVAQFLWYLLPQAVYLMTPLALLLAVMVEIALMNRRNEIVAIKGAGINLYRVLVPVLLLALAFSGLLFWLDSSYLPQANQQQEALRNVIRGRPARTFFQLDRRWVFGKTPRIYHYAFFDPRQKVLARLEVLELNREDFSLQRRLFAERAHWEPEMGSWVLEEGWERTFAGGQTDRFEAFNVGFFPELQEEPEYFRKEVRESQQMNWRELGNYIDELEQSGLDVTTLVVEWHKKFAFPLVATVMVLLAFPFGLAVGRRGALGGIAFGIGLGLGYWVLVGFFQALGNFGLLPPVLSGWGPNILFTAGGLYLGLHIET